jgi:adenosylcobinamide-GDP ribazoletransferase
MKRWLSARWSEWIAALTLLTRLPVGGFTASHPPPGDCIWAYPLVGAVVGAVGAAMLWLAMRAGMPQPVAVLWVLAAMVLLTGGLHEDGLADVADGLGGGRSRERKLAIMRDSRIGTFGALALVFSLGLRLLDLALSPHPLRVLLLAAVLGRGAMLLPLLLLSPARADGLAAALGQRRLAPLAAGLALSAAAAWLAPAAGLAALLAGLVVAALAQTQVGGYTGDVFGAAEQAAECAVLSALVGVA